MLDREEYIEQAYFFRVYRERIEATVPAQEILAAIHEEILATTKLPMAIEFLRGEIMLTGRISDGMNRLRHYFTAFQSFVMSRAEEERSKFDVKVALEILAKEAEYRTHAPTPAGLFVYQFECLARNRLGYDHGMLAMSEDPFFSAEWKEWIRRIRLRLGTTEFTDLIYYRSQQYVDDRRRRGGDAEWLPSHPIFFSGQEGRIAKANRGKDPLYMFAALQRQLGYPAVPRSKPTSSGPNIHPALEARLQRMEERLKLMEMETKDGIDLSKLAVRPDDWPNDQKSSQNS